MAAAASLGDMIALKIQELQHTLDEPRPLVRIDNREHAATAPLQFDTVLSQLHRRDCRAIPASSRTALYGLWQIPPQARQYACPVCRPEAQEPDEMAADGPTDYIYGLLSVLDQFGGVIRERGREYRESDKGRQLKDGLDGVYRGLEERERATLQVVLNSLDGLIATLSDVHEGLDAEAGQANGNGNQANHNHDHNQNGNGAVGDE